MARTSGNVTTRNGAGDLEGAAAGPPAGRDRSIRRRRSLPGSRAVVGGLVIALAAVLTFWAYAGAARSPHQLYVVAARDLAPGDRIRPADLHLVALDLTDPGVRRQVFGSPEALVGASVVAPITTGALIEASAVIGRGGPPGSRELSLDIDRSRAVGGTLKPGEYVDVLATFGTGSTSYTSLIAPHVRLLTVSAAGGSLGAAPTELFVVAVPDGVSAEAVADAAIAAQVSLVRAAEQPGGAPATSLPTYHAPPGTGANP